MKKYRIKKINKIKRTISIPADKSISHRAIILSSICKGQTKINNFLDCQDTKSTAACLKKLGVIIKQRPKEVIVEGKEKYFSKSAKEPLKLYANDSGTTMRILSGLLSAQKFPIIFEGAASLNRRPMRRIVEPLKQMGAVIEGRKEKLSGFGAKEDIYPPLAIKPVAKLKARAFNLPIASAQVKSALMLASLYAEGQTKIREPYQSRDHTERIFELFKANISIQKDRVIVCSKTECLESPGEIFIPADFSSAAFFIVLGLILKNSQVRIRGVNTNPTRCGLLEVLKRMGAQISIENETKDSYEPYADIKVKSSPLRATEVNPQEVPAMIDEIPILGVVSAFAEGTTIIKGIGELKVKETNRIDSLFRNLSKAGVEVKVTLKDEISITGRKQFKPTNFMSFGDHRTAMSAVVLGAAIGGCSIDNLKCIDKSFPQFISTLESLAA